MGWHDTRHCTKRLNQRFPVFMCNRGPWRTRCFHRVKWMIGDGLWGTVPCAVVEFMSGCRLLFRGVVRGWTRTYAVRRNGVAGENVVCCEKKVSSWDAKCCKVG